MSTQPTDNLPAEYATIRNALEEGRQMSQLFGNPYKTQGFRDALAALDRLAARELPAATDSGASALEAREHCECWYNGETGMHEYCENHMPTPPAPQAAECAAHAALKVLWEEYQDGEGISDSEHDCDYYRNPQTKECEFCKIEAQVDAALATPCQHGSEQSEIARLRAELEEWKEEFGTDNPELAKLESTNFGASEMVRVIMDLESPGVIGDPKAQMIREMLKGVDALRAELAQARKATEESEKLAVDAIRSEHELAAELRRAVDALRPHAIARSRYHAAREIAAIVAAYDAKHGEKL